MVPCDSAFTTKGAYYETLLHELAHWSEVRLGWTAKYEMNELVAEIAASFLSSELGIPQGESLENHAAYVRTGWRQCGAIRLIFSVPPPRRPKWRTSCCRSLPSRSKCWSQSEPTTFPSDISVRKPRLRSRLVCGTCGRVVGRGFKAGKQCFRFQNSETILKFPVAGSIWAGVRGYTTPRFFPLIFTYWSTLFPIGKPLTSELKPFPIGKPSSKRFEALFTPMGQDIPLIEIEARKRFPGHWI